MQSERLKNFDTVLLGSYLSILVREMYGKYLLPFRQSKCLNYVTGQLTKLEMGRILIQTGASLRLAMRGSRFDMRNVQGNGKWTMGNNSEEETRKEERYFLISCFMYRWEDFS